jgi:hypothetical protein
MSDTRRTLAVKFLVTGVIGAVVGVATGYAVYAVSNSPYSGGVIVWSDTHFGAMDATLFAIIGAGVAMELSFSNR